MGKKKLTRREFIKGVTVTEALVSLSELAGAKRTFSYGDKSRISRVVECPIHDDQLRLSRYLRRAFVSSYYRYSPRLANVI